LTNFGAIELAAQGWLHLLSVDQLLISKLSTFRLRQRIDLIRSLVEAGRIPVGYREEAARLWKRVGELTEMRDQVAHNGVVYGWAGPERPGPANFAGVIDRRKNVQNAERPRLITLIAITRAQDEVAQVALRLHALAEAVEADAAQPTSPPAPE
jgi:hypothetical protein